MPFKYDLAVGKGSNRYDGQELWFRVASKAPDVSEGVAGESRLKTARKTVILHSQCRYKDTVRRKVNAEEVFSTLNADCKCHSCYRMNKASGPFRFPNEGA
jgi:hypothetical protein